MEASDVAQELKRAFAGRTRGELRTDAVARNLYATDASPYRIEPQAVLIAREPDDIAAAIEVCRGLGVAITARGAGTSLSGQCVGAGLNLDLSLLNRIESIDAESRIARVQPGVTWWQLNQALKAHGLEFGPDPATKRQCTLGGMVGTNAGGTHSLIYGASVDHLHRADVVMADGRRATLQQSTDGGLASTGLPSEVAAALELVRTKAAPLMGPSFSTLARRGSGYQLEHLCTDFPHAAKLLAASDGTLALMTSLELTLDPLPAVRVLGVVGFADMHDAIAMVPELVDTQPCAVELVSRSLLDVARRDPFHAAGVAGVDASLGALLFVEYQGSTESEAVAGLDRMDRVVGSAPYSERFVDPTAAARMWAIREAGVGALSSVAGGPLLPQAFVEDTIVAVGRLPGYIRELDALFTSYGMDVVWYGHASTGLIHTRPFLDMTSADDLTRLESLMERAVDLINAWGGDLCGEHGDGLARTYFNERLFGPELYGQLRALKGVFDPANLLNPGKVVEGPRPTENLRYGPGYRRHIPVTSYNYDDQGGFAAATERCFGAGVCRKRLNATMCPPAMATGLEQHSTRARANLLRSVVAGHLDPGELSGLEAREVMETCVACKACKTECPARVDMARLKTEWMDIVRRREGATLMQRSIGSFRDLAKLASVMPSIANATMKSKLLRSKLGVASERSLPLFAKRPLTKMMQRGAGDASLFADCFTTYQDPEIGMAVSKLGKAAGMAVTLADVGCCGRTMLSEGYIEKARKTALKTAAKLRAIEGPILFTEPSCLSAVTDDWPNLIGDVSDLKARCVEAEQWVAIACADVKFLPGGTALLHGHCHQKALWGTGGTEAALALVDDLEVRILDAGCCGMAGAFGYLSERYELSIAMAERVLAPAVRELDAETQVLATGTSCRHQIHDTTNRTATHPLAFLASRLVLDDLGQAD